MLADHNIQNRWWLQYKDALPQGYMHYIQHESEAVKIQSFNADVIPGFYQTELYARGVIEQFRGSVLSEDECDQRLALRMQRQWNVLEKPHPPRLHIVIEEAALLRTITSKHVQYEQLAHLVRMATLPNITIQILPLSKGVLWGIFGQPPFDIFTFNTPEKPLLFTDEQSDHVKRDSTFEVTHYRTTFKTLSEKALDSKDSVALIQDIAKNLLQSLTKT
jgi:hypothetical protein